MSPSKRYFWFSTINFFQCYNYTRNLFYQIGPSWRNISHKERQSNHSLCVLQRERERGGGERGRGRQLTDAILTVLSTPAHFCLFLLHRFFVWIVAQLTAPTNRPKTFFTLWRDKLACWVRRCDGEGSNIRRNDTECDTSCCWTSSSSLALINIFILSCFKRLDWGKTR
jgi:hypothetical protein